MSIGTAKPTQEELNQAEHHFIDSHSINEPVSAGEYERIAIEKLDELFQENDKVILTGGSGLFIDALCTGLDDLPPADMPLRNSLNNQLEELGIEFLQDQLKKLDPDYYEQVDQKNPHRLIRAIELCTTSGKKMADIQNQPKPTRPFQVIYVALTIDRKLLYKRINTRVEKMMEQGLLKEVQSLTKFKDLQPLNTVGYSEIFEFLDNKISLDEAIELIKRNSRRYAKRQLTWFKRNNQFQWFEPNQFDNIIEHLNLKMQ